MGLSSDGVPVVATAVNLPMLIARMRVGFGPLRPRRRRCLPAGRTNAVCATEVASPRANVTAPGTCSTLRVSVEASVRMCATLRAAQASHLASATAQGQYRTVLHIAIEMHTLFLISIENAEIMWNCP